MFKEMAAAMPDREIERCMSILVEGSVILSIKRDVIQNAIDKHSKQRRKTKRILFVIAP